MTIQISTNPIPSSGSLSFSTLRNNLKGSNSGSVKISDYYRNGSIVPDSPTNSGLPTSGSVSLTQFRNCIAIVNAVITGVEQNLNTSTIFGNQYGFNIRKVATINGYVISQNSTPALTVNSGSPSAVELNFVSGGVFGSRGAANSGVYYPLGSLNAYDNGIGVPTYQSYEVVGQDCYDQCYKGGCNQICNDVYGYVTREYGPSESANAGLSGGNGSGAVVTWYWWSQNGRVSWGLADGGSRYANGDSLSFVAGSRGTFNVVGYVNSGVGADGAPGGRALVLNQNTKISGSGSIRGGGGGGGQGGNGGQEGGGGANYQGRCCGWFCPSQGCGDCNRGVGGGSDAGGAGGAGGSGVGYSWNGTTLTQVGPDPGQGGVNPNNGGGAGGSGGSGGNWASAGSDAGGGAGGATGPGGNCRGGDGGQGGQPGGKGNSGGASVVNQGYVVGGTYGGVSVS